ncbi:formamidopyrimidine-DNA glycosylase [Tersicoccus solisilvae]|uniref:Formamidopyrimidine-DNA glycosylase n=1 Tax=Tersicoccus solisilvae TaxID=1882339 RepID=A0ABQ1PDA3_9MICC|nr:bifunctional DNA-formamidopyrimidine glycosylase/DNA-(apurinic or apyrimidinic site) lyase [Tersicoccus solisilvae]GGC94963.1 formamidopyrimidine-DNA glycosylase [Tersicoccus solisilvae]
MPELPEVEVVRRGLAPWAVGRTVTDVDVVDPRSIRRHPGGTEAFTAALTGRRLTAAVRRGKFLWLPLAAPGADAEPTALVVHLGMSGQVLIQPAASPDEKHLRIRLRLDPAADAPPSDGPERQLRFVDQRIFGGMHVDRLVCTEDGAPGGSGSELTLIPASAAHIARDPLDPAFDVAAFTTRLRRRRTGIKRALLDQSLISGIGNIYADESLWRARLHYARPTETLRRPEVERLLAACREVMGTALDAGGTSFDALYVNVNGQSGYFDRSLAVYGQAGRLCPRCAANGRHSVVRRDSFMNRGSFTCPVCQPKPRRARW